MPFLNPSGSSLCVVCLRGEYRFEVARAFGIYADPLRSLILLLKYRRFERLARPLAGALAAVWVATPEFRELESPLLVPVPLHHSRERQRGFNQAAHLARDLKRRLGRMSPKLKADFDARGLVRIRATPPQSGLNFRERKENVRGVFRAKRAGRLRGRNVVLIDDVMTTGATLSACAEAAAEAGAARIFALAVARAHSDLPATFDPDAVPEVDAASREWR